MGVMIEIDPHIRIRVLEMQLQRKEADYEALLIRCAELIDDRNHLVADRERTRQANAELLRRIDAMDGYPRRALLAA